jgi:hypothetical protein
MAVQYKDKRMHIISSVEVAIFISINFTAVLLIGFRIYYIIHIYISETVKYNIFMQYFSVSDSSFFRYSMGNAPAYNVFHYDVIDNHSSSIVNNHIIVFMGHYVGAWLYDLFKSWEYIIPIVVIGDDNF